MRRVAFLSFDWDYKIVSEYYLGLQDRLKKRTDIQLVIFNAFGLYYVAHTPKESYFEIFSLFNPQDYDGIIIQGNRTWPRETLLPQMSSHCRLYLVSPLRHNDICVGIIVTEGVPEAISYGLNTYYLSMLASALVAAKKSELLKAAYER